MRHILIASVLLTIWTGCTEPKPKVVYANSNDTTDTVILVDTNLIPVASLPVHYDSTVFLIHALGRFSANDRAAKSFLYSGNSNSSSVGVIYRSGYTISGDIENLKFQHVDSTNLNTLTNLQIRIRSFTFLRDVFDSSKEKILTYRVTDFDSNRDGKLNDLDIESLYLSYVDGSNFKKITPKFHEFLYSKVIEVQSKLYFVTSEDVDQNGIFDKKDQLHYFYVDLTNGTWNTIEYNPIID
jgi:hypothetical protein